MSYTHQLRKKQMEVAKRLQALKAKNVEVCGVRATIDGWDALHAQVAALTETVGVRDDILALTAARGTGVSEQQRAGLDSVMYLFHYRDTGLKRDVGTVSYVESRSCNYDNAAKEIIQKLQDAGVKRGQVLSIDAHASNDGEAVFSAHYSLQLADEGPLEVELSIKRMADTHEGWNALYQFGLNTAETVGISKNIIAMTALCEIEKMTRTSRFPETLRYVREYQLPSSIMGQAYMQGGSLGVASYHFPEIDQAYISYEAAPPQWTLDDGQPPPQQKPFVNPRYDEATRTFTGTIDWSDNNFHGDARWEYEMVFSEDFARITGGQVRSCGACACAVCWCLCVLRAGNTCANVHVCARAYACNHVRAHARYRVFSRARKHSARAPTHEHTHTHTHTHTCAGMSSRAARALRFGHSTHPGRRAQCLFSRAIWCTTCTLGG